MHRPYRNCSFPILGNKMSYGYILRKPANAISLSSAALLHEMFSPVVWLGFVLTLVLVVLLISLSHRLIDCQPFCKSIPKVAWKLITIVRA